MSPLQFHVFAPPSSAALTHMTTLPSALPRLRHLDDVVQRLVRRFQETADIARGLTDALLILDDGDSNIVIAMLAEADAGSHRDLRLLDQQLGEFERAEMAEFLGDRHPGEHRG